jgi:hypothetical protein
MDLLDIFNARAKRYLEDIQNNPVYPSSSSVQALQQLNGSLQEESMEASDVFDLLDSVGSAATVKSSGGRYFGFVTGGSLPAAMFAKLLATVWDQNTALFGYVADCGNIGRH